jgi:ankyrin repeat protein
MSTVAMNRLRIILLVLPLLVGWFAEPADALRELDRQLMESVQEGSAAKVKTLIAKGASTKAKDEAGNTALHFASQKDIAGMLISAGASVNTRNDDFGMTPLFNVPAEVAALLIAKGADVNARARKGMTPLSWAVYWDQKDKMALLISKGAEVNAKDDDGKTALHIAANWGKVDIAALLIAKGADVNARDSDCWTPLHWAAFEATADAMDLLLSAGADRNAVSCPSGGLSSPVETPLDVARRFRSPDVVAYLKSRGCKSSAHD